MLKRLRAGVQKQRVAFWSTQTNRPRRTGLNFTTEITAFVPIIRGLGGFAVQQGLALVVGFGLLS